MNIALLSGGGCYLYYALHSIFGWWMLFIPCPTHHFRVVDTIYTVQYVVFLGGGFYINYALRSIFQGPDSIYTMNIALLSGGGYYLYYALRSIFGEGCYLNYALRSIFAGRKLFIL